MRDDEKALVDRISNFFLKTKEVIFILTSLSAGIVFVIQLGAPDVKNHNSLFYSLFIEAANILVILIGLFAFKNRHLLEKPSDNHQLISLEVDDKRKPSIEDRIKKTNEVVAKLLLSLRGFLVCLMLLYTFLFISDYSNERLREKNETTYISTCEALENQHAISLVDLICNKDQSYEPLINDIIVTIIANFFNISSTVFLLMAFYILYHQTEDVYSSEDIKTTNGYWLPSLIAIILILFNTLTLIVGFADIPLRTLVISARITSGMFNGIGMALIVSRVISMEYFFKMSDRLAKNFYLIGTIVALPLYVVAQPLWGFFDMDFSGHYLTKNIILLLCFWGKAFFILIIYYLLQKRWLHAYIYMLPLSENQMRLFSNYFDDVDNIVTPPAAGQDQVSTSSNSQP